MSSTIILSRPLGPKELLMTLEMACVAWTVRQRPGVSELGAFGEQRGTHTVLVADVAAGNLLTAQEEGPVPGLIKKRRHFSRYPGVGGYPGVREVEDSEG